MMKKPEIKIDVTRDDPFHIKKKLRAEFPEVKDKEIDLSRGEPYNPPDIYSDAVFAGFFNWSLAVSEIIGDNPLSNAPETAIFNAKTNIRRYQNIPVDLMDYTLDTILSICDSYNREASPEASPKANQEASPEANQKPRLTKLDLIRLILSGVRGEDYTDTLGENPVRALVARHLQNVINAPDEKGFQPDEIILTIGGSEAIGALAEIFMSIDLFGKGCNDKAKYKVAMLSPLYSPYKFIFDKMGVEIYPIKACDNNGYEPDNAAIKQFRENAKNIKLLILVNPGNPTGRSLSPEVLKKLADICIENNILIITDIVYAPFLKEPMESIIKYAPKNTILVGSGSKFYQETGTRFGFILITKEADKFIMENLGDKFKKFYQYEGSEEKLSFIEVVDKAKGPDPLGTFYHTHHVPTPVQWLGAFRLLLGEEDARKFTHDLFERWEALYHGLGLKTPLEKFPEAKYVPYYALIDLVEVAKENGFKNLEIKMNSGIITPEFFIKALYSETHVLILPAATFFPGEETANVWKVRFSVANQPIDKIKKAVSNILNLMRKYN